MNHKRISLFPSLSLDLSSVPSSPYLNFLFWLCALCSYINKTQLSTFPIRVRLAVHGLLLLLHMLLDNSDEFNCVRFTNYDLI